jgi:hypothetical protein
MQIAIIITCARQPYMYVIPVIPDAKFPDICIHNADYSLQMCNILIAFVFVYVWVICFFQAQEKTLSTHLRSEESWGSKLQQRHRLARSKVWRAEGRKCTHWRKHCIKFRGVKTEIDHTTASWVLFCMLYLCTPCKCIRVCALLIVVVIGNKRWPKASEDIQWLLQSAYWYVLPIADVSSMPYAADRRSHWK